MEYQISSKTRAAIEVYQWLRQFNPGQFNGFIESLEKNGGKLSVNSEIWLRRDVPNKCVVFTDVNNNDTFPIQICPVCLKIYNAYIICQDQMKPGDIFKRNADA